MEDDKIARRILRFMRQMNAEASDDQLIERAQASRWLRDDGRPTDDGATFARTLEDMDRLNAPRF